MKILALRADNQACGLYRIQLPLEHAAREGLIEYEILEDLPVDAVIEPDGNVTVHRVNVKADLIIFQRPLLGAFLPAMRQAQKQGIKCVVELDDDLSSVDRDNLAYRAVDPKTSPTSNWRNLLATARQADWVTASTPAIARKFGRPSRSSVIRNTLPSDIFEIEKHIHEPPRVGWSGSVATHPHDLSVLGVHLRTVLRNTHTSFSMLGEDDGVKRQLGFDDTDDFTCASWVPLDEYYSALSSTFDIGVVPLAPTSFNEAKSYLKGLEMAGLGIPFVASPTSEYRYLSALGVGSIARKGIQWQSKVKQLITDRDHLLEESARVRDAVRHLTYENAVESWMDAWSSALSTKQGSTI
jgi:hypothetical protein